MEFGRNYWAGFAAGAAAAVGAMAAWRIFGIRSGSAHVLRLEKSVQIGRPVQEVFQAWSDFNRLQALVPKIQEIRRFGDRMHWAVEVDGRRIEWDAEVVQFVENQAIGWKSVSGPKHTGRINFSPLEKDTVIHVTMNYAPPLGRFARALAPVEDELEVQIEQALRDFKAALEGKGQERVAQPRRATGTYGAGRQNSMGLEPPVSQDAPEGAVSFTAPEERPGTVDHNRPPNAKY